MSDILIIYQCPNNRLEMSPTQCYIVQMQYSFGIKYVFLCLCFFVGFHFPSEFEIGSMFLCAMWYPCSEWAQVKQDLENSCNIKDDCQVCINYPTYISCFISLFALILRLVHVHIT